MKVLVFGANNSGKGTLVKLLSEKTGLKTISCSSVLNKKGLDITTGKLLPNADVIEIMHNCLYDKRNNSFILEGFPRTLQQHAYMKYYLFEPDLIIVLDISEEEVIKRAVGRRLCEKCGDSYNLNGYKMPKQEGTCDLCGGKLYQRKDDEEGVVRARYNEYITQTYPVVLKYKEKDGKPIVWEFDTSQSTEEIANVVAEYINYMMS